MLRTHYDRNTLKHKRRNKKGLIHKTRARLGLSRRSTRPSRAAIRTEVKNVVPVKTMQEQQAASIEIRSPPAARERVEREGNIGFVVRVKESGGRDSDRRAKSRVIHLKRVVSEFFYSLSRILNRCKM